MSRGLGKIERLILDTCLECLTIKEKMLTKGGDPFEHYSGGERNAFRSGSYERCIYKGRQKEEIIDLSEDVIDLREVSHKIRHKIGRSEANQAGYARAIGSLKRKGYFQGGRQWWRLRFTRLDMDKLKGYESIHNT